MKLEGVRVIDLSAFLPGPLLTQMMADQGAEIIKIEPPGEGEPVRHVRYRQGDTTVWFRNTHRAKRSVVLNLKDPAGVEALMRLAEGADVMLEAFRPGVVDRLGVGPAQVRARNPKLVYCSIAAFGQTGPMRDRPAHNPAIEAQAGTASLAQGQDGLPTMSHIPAADMAGSFVALAGILMALYRRQTTGLGDTIDISMQDSIMAWLPNVIGSVFAENRAPIVKEERALGGASFNNVYRCQDGLYIVLGGVEAKFAKNLLTALGRPDLIPLATGLPGPAQAPMTQFLREAFATKPRAEWESFLGKLDVAWAPLLDLKQAFEHEQVKAREMLLIDDQGFQHVGTPIKFADEPGRIDFSVPKLGEHTDRVLAAAGYSAAEIAALRAKGAVA